MDQSSEQVVQKVGEVIMAHSQSADGSCKLLHRFETWELEYFPLRYLINCARPNELKAVWSYLPKSYRENEELQKCLPCLRHYNTGKYQIDGPPTRQKNCLKCISHNNLCILT